MSDLRGRQVNGDVRRQENGDLHGNERNIQIIEADPLTDRRTFKGRPKAKILLEYSV